MARATVSVEDLESGHLPDVCAKTGLHADGFTTIQVSNLPGWTFILLLFGIWPFLIALYFAPRRVKGRVPMSNLALRRLKVFTATYLILLISGLVLLGIGLFGEHPTVESLGLIALLATIAVIVGGYLYVYPTGRFLDDNWISLSLVDQGFAEALDRWYGESRRDQSTKQGATSILTWVIGGVVVIAVLYFLSMAYCTLS